jgi:hypothetical protein
VVVEKNARETDRFFNNRYKMSLAVKQISRPLRQTFRLFLIHLLVLLDRYIAYRAAVGRPMSR